MNARGSSQRSPLRWQLEYALIRLAAPVGEALVRPAVLRRLRFIPSLPRPVRARYLSPRRPWSYDLPPIPDELRTVPGIRRDPVAAAAAYEQDPIYDWNLVHWDGNYWALRKLWRSLLPVAPRLRRAIAAADVGPAPGQAPTRVVADPDTLTRELKAFAAEIGLSAIGVAKVTPEYTFADSKGEEVGDRIVVCLLERNWAMTQTSPSARGEQTALSTTGEAFELVAKVAGFLRDCGYKAQPYGLGHALSIPYAVDAGLGQLGLNGQLLTPGAGSRCRIELMCTDAPLVLDQPVDFGIPAICDRCQACVRRCPVGAIPAKRKMHRGVEKAKINTARCFPTVGQVHGCAVCMKVCPVQRYGLPAILEEYERSGEILGKNTDELEGYDWPLDGKHYGPGTKPTLPPGFFKPPGTDFDFTRKLPMNDERALA